MNHTAVRVLGIGALVLVAGCRTATRVTEFPRVDLQVEGSGNRGYLVGTPPPAAELKTTREMVETIIEVPSYYTPKPGQTAPVSDEVAGAAAPAATEPIGTMVGEESPGASPQTFDTYVVKKGDSLWSIAAKPEIYGKASRWQRIYTANRDQLKSPDALRPGMTLKIPRGEDDSSFTYDDEGGVTFKK